MDTGSIASLASEMATTRTQQAAQMSVLKKAMEMQGQGVMQLVQAAAPASNNPPHLGNSIDVLA